MSEHDTAEHTRGRRRKKTHHRVEGGVADLGLLLLAADDDLHVRIADTFVA